jgi:hypothetical protein
MGSFIAIAQGFKIAAGLAQVVFALWVVIRSPRIRTNVAFALAFGANGVAYAIFNLVRPEFRTPHSFALEGRGVFNWIATLAMVLFAVFFLKMLQHARARLLVVPVSIALVMMVSDVLQTRAYHLDFLGFGGMAIYPATGFALVLFALIFMTESSIQLRSQCALYSAALAINSVDHIGAAVVRSDWQFPGAVVTEFTVMLIILGLWLWNSRVEGLESSRMALTVVFFIVAPFLAGVFVRIALGSYRAVQESGFIGAGRIAATGLLVYGMLARGLFSPRSERIGAPIFATQPVPDKPSS